MADGSDGNVGARLAKAGLAKERRAREALWKELEPGVMRFVATVLPEDPAAARELALVIREFGVSVALLVARDADLLRALGPSQALVLDGEGGSEVIAAPSPLTPSLDVDRLIAAGKAVVRELRSQHSEAWVEPRLEASIRELDRVIRGEP